MAPNENKLNSTDSEVGLANSASRNREILLEAGTNEVEFLEFGIGGQRFGVNVAKIVQIVDWNTLKFQRIPDQAEGIVGTVLYRDECITAYGLRELLSLPPATEPITRPIFIVMNFNQRTYGFVVDTLYGIERVSWSEFRPVNASQFSCGIQSVIGTVLIEERLIMVLDFEAMMAQVDPSVSAERFADNVKMTSAIDRKQVRVLYCEDSPTVRMVTMQVLKEAGFINITTTINGFEGWKLLSDGKGKNFDVVLTDIEMPQMDGLTLCKKIKDDDKTRHLPVIFFSSLISDEMKLKCQSVQGDASFSKPQVSMVADAIDEFMSKKE